MAHNNSIREKPMEREKDSETWALLKENLPLNDMLGV